MISESPLADIDYADILSFPALEPIAADLPLTRAEGEIIMALAVRFGRTRLIDNIVFTPKEVAALV
ncbi:pantoate--beta-alanine ligase [compost metagenome]